MDAIIETCAQERYLRNRDFSGVPKAWLKQVSFPIGGFWKPALSLRIGFPNRVLINSHRLALSLVDGTPAELKQNYPPRTIPTCEGI